MSQPVLMLLDPSKPFVIQCDVFDDYLGAIILQDGHAIAYKNCQFYEQERVLGIYEKELLAASTCSFFLEILPSWHSFHHLNESPRH